MLKRNKSSHKGQNGRVCIVGGSKRFHGAPIFASLAAEATGVDLVYPIVPSCHSEVTKQASYNFICDYFKLSHLTVMDVHKINDVLKESDALVIGPGLGDKGLTISAIYDIIKKTSVPVVIDASALQAVSRFYEEENILPDHSVITPHKGEFEKITGKKLTGTQKKKQEEVQNLAKKLETIVLLKGEKDIIANSEDLHVINRTGNAGLTVGGTGDVLAGVIGGLIAQDIHPVEACKMAVNIVGACGDALFKEKCYAYNALDVIECIPRHLCKVRH